MRIKGFTVTEMTAVLLIAVILSAVSISEVPRFTGIRMVPKLFGSEMMKLQADSIRNGKRREILFGENSVNDIALPAEVDGNDIHIMEDGNIDHPQTVIFYGKTENLSVPVWLGTGRTDVYEN